MESDNIDKSIDNNNIIIDKLDDNIVKPKLRENTAQLTDTKKKKFGFKLNQSIIDVEQNGYSICYGNDTLYTYGIEPCCGLVVCDENVRILFHLDGTITLEDVLTITDEANLSQDAMVIVIPGASCGIPGSFNYKLIEEDYKRKGYKVLEQRIPATFGFVMLESDQVTIGTGINRSYDKVLMLPKRKIQAQSTESTSIQELIDLKKQLIDSNNNISEKKR